jgi:hypothetical protein
MGRLLRLSLLRHTSLAVWAWNRPAVTPSLTLSWRIPANEKE